MSTSIRAGGDDAPLKRPSHNPKPTTTLLEHSEGAALPSQQRKINEYRAAEAAKRTEQNKNLESEKATSTTAALSRSPSSKSCIEIPSSPAASSDHASASAKRKGTAEDDDKYEETDEEANTQRK
jgi:hypothetical protein